MIDFLIKLWVKFMIENLECLSLNDILGYLYNKEVVNI